MTCTNKKYIFLLTTTLTISDFEITLSKPQKLCDYKCAYGVIFEDYIQDYDWWGHCDLDQIFGNLNMFVTEDMLRKYDKLFSLGHLSLYKNSYKNNRIFMGKILIIPKNP